MSQALFDLVDGEIVVADDRPTATYEPPKLRGDHVNRNVRMLEEHLTFAVPPRMRELKSMADRHPNTRAGDTWQQVLLQWFYWPGRKQRTYGIDTANKPMQVATQGDLLLSVEGQHKEAGTIAAALVDGLAVGALVNPDGIAYRGLHWCLDHCPKPVRTPPPADWKHKFDQILDDLLEGARR